MCVNFYFFDIDISDFIRNYSYLLNVRVLRVII